MYLTALLFGVWGVAILLLIIVGALMLRMARQELKELNKEREQYEWAEMPSPTDKE